MTHNTPLRKIFKITLILLVFFVSVITPEKQVEGQAASCDYTNPDCAVVVHYYAILPEDFLYTHTGIPQEYHKRFKDHIGKINSWFKKLKVCEQYVIGSTNTIFVPLQFSRKDTNGDGKVDTPLTKQESVDPNIGHGIFEDQNYMGYVVTDYKVMDADRKVTYGNNQKKGVMEYLFSDPNVKSNLFNDDSLVVFGFGSVQTREITPEGGATEVGVTKYTPFGDLIRMVGAPSGNTWKENLKKKGKDLTSGTGTVFAPLHDFTNPAGQKSYADAILAHELKHAYYDHNQWIPSFNSNHHYHNPPGYERPSKDLPPGNLMRGPGAGDFMLQALALTKGQIDYQEGNCPTEKKEKDDYKEIPPPPDTTYNELESYGGGKNNCRYIKIKLPDGGEGGKCAENQPGDPACKNPKEDCIETKPGHCECK